MCGIVAILDIKEQTHALREKALKMSQKIRHHGPDWSGIYCGGSAILAHERLSIVDPESGGQPLFSPDRKQVLAVNGEIYNHQEIRRRYAGQYDFQTGSDCEVILALYREKGINILEDLSGIFAFVLYDEEKNEFLIARDPIGVIPLYIGYDSDGKVYVAMSDKLLFESGKAIVNAQGKEALGKLAGVLNRQTDIDVYIEGHTDNVPIKTAVFQDNWDLSVIRATSVVRILTETYGVNPLQIQPCGRGEFKPVDINTTSDGRARNRRTEIIRAPRLDKLFKMLQEGQQ